eukprot:TRINITY_DN66220_c0_g1_i1.p1 TRINITY_DN66220_c0_g1~~TRINITY_DN66220_c0_g1_i1.p1  ORF type:complete len:480 (-),score=71.49 TRINITY_DN66220_c0_g1_i1:144-1583(-)
MDCEQQEVIAILAHDSQVEQQNAEGPKSSPARKLFKVACAVIAVSLAFVGLGVRYPLAAFTADGVIQRSESIRKGSRVDLGYDSAVARVQVAVGKPASEKIEVTFDTGSYDFWVFSGGKCSVSNLPKEHNFCPSGYSDPSHIVGKCQLDFGSFDSSSSETWSDESKHDLDPNVYGDDSCQTYGIGWVHGKSGQDWLHFDSDGKDLSVFKGVTIMNYQEKGFGSQSGGGILGMRPRSGIAGKDFFLEEYTVCLPRCKEGLPGEGSCYPETWSGGKAGTYKGFACFNGTCDDECEVNRGLKDLEWQYAYWATPFMSVDVASMKAVGKETSTSMCLPMFVPKGGPRPNPCGGLNILFDSGYALGAASQEVIEYWFAAVIKSMKHASCKAEWGPAVQGIKTLELSCQNDITDWPVIEFDYGGIDLEMKPEHYVTVRKSSTAFRMQIENVGNMAILGASYAFAAFHVKFDPANARNGIQLPRRQ